MSEAVVVVNAGSTSLKFGAYAVDASRSLPLLCGGQIDGMESDPHFVVKNVTGKQLGAHEWGKNRAIDHKTALQFVITWLEANLGDSKVIAAGHRIVLGGSRFEAPVLIDADVLTYLDSLVIDGTVAPALQRARSPCAGRGVPRSAPGRLLRHLLPPNDDGGGANLRAAPGGA